MLQGARDGISLARLLREEIKIAVVFTTSYADQLTITRAQAVKPNGYLVKPFRREDVYAAVEVALAQVSEIN